MAEKLIILIKDKNMICSIIIPTFNRKEVLKNSLMHLSRQKNIDNDFEVLIVDDGSTDGTGELIEEIKGDLPFAIRYFNTSLTDVNGVSVARNTGIKEAVCNKLIFIDDDMSVYPYFVAAHLDALKKNLVVQGHISHKADKLNEVPPVSVEEGAALRSMKESREGNLMELTTGNFSIYKKVFDLVGLFDERFAKKDEYGYEDVELAQRIFFSTINIYFEENALSYLPLELFERDEAKIGRSDRARKTWWEVINDPPKDSKIYPMLELRRDHFTKEIVERKLRNQRNGD